MDALGVIFIVLFLITIFYPNFVFFKGLKKTSKSHYIHKLFYFLISVIISFSIFCGMTFIIIHWNIKIMLNSYVYLNTNIFRIIFESITFIFSLLTNLYILKFYLKRISKIKNKNEIELIGSE